MTHTFVIPVFGESEYLRDCIKSLKKQTVPSNIILTSANETEFLKNISKEFNVPYYINKDGNQIGKDWNYALEKADTDLVTIAHQDDVYLNNYLEQILSKVESNPDSVIYFTDYHEIRDDKVVRDNLNLKIKKLLLTPQKLFPSKFSQNFAIMLGSAICCPAVTYNKSILGDYKFNETLKSNLDWMAWVDFHKSGQNFSYIPKALMLHRIHAGSETSNQIKESNRQNEDLIVLKRFWPKGIAQFIEYFYKKSEIRNSK